MRRIACLLAGACALAVAAGAHAAPPVPVMTGLDNPRGVAIGPEGGLYVAEAGRGGAGACVPLPDGPGTRCYGPTGAISRLWRGRQERIATGLPSLAAQTQGDTASGPQHISFLGRRLFVTIGCSCNRNDPTGALLEELGFGYLMRVSPSGRAKAVADVAAYEARANPDGAQIDSNPYGLLALPRDRLVTDAGGNSLVDVAANGSITTVATFPKLSAPFGLRDAVPTNVVLGPDGAYYVSTLTGFPFTAGTAIVYRVVAGQAPTLYAWNLTQLTDLAFAGDGSLYVLQHSSAIPTLPSPFAGPGAVLRVPPGGGPASTVVAGGLPRATGLAVDDDGSLFVAVNGASAGNGQVWKITQEGT
jgi:sugar lactone lactonase YvrE